MTKRFVIGLLWSVMLIVVPALLLSLDIWPAFMFGATIGATVRLGTDMALLVMSNGDGDGFEQFVSSHIPLVLLLMLIQFGTLFGAIGWLLLSESVVPIGIVAAILASYIYGIVSRGIFGTTTQEQSDDDGEWKFDIEDVTENQ